jgi:hypothetical protein
MCVRDKLSKFDQKKWAEVKFKRSKWSKVQNAKGKDLPSAVRKNAWRNGLRKVEKRRAVQKLVFASFALPEMMMTCMRNRE